MHSKENRLQKKHKKPTEWEKIFANDVNNKRFISKIYKLSHRAQCQKTTQPENGQKIYIDISPQKAREKMVSIDNY